MRCLLILLAVSTLTAATSTENHPDGSRALTVNLDKEGRRDGALTAWWPGGKVLKEKSKWNDGVLHGIRTLYDEKGKEQTEETWIRGRLIYPRSQAQTELGLARVEAEAQRWIATWPKPSNPEAAAPAEQAKALVRLRQYRWLSGVSADVTLDDRYTDEAQEAAKLLVAIGKLDHHPTQPPGYEAASFAKASNGCGHGNLAQGAGDLVRAVDMWMDDSDASNIAALGHRRWMLNPVMQSCGFGISGKFSVIWAHDSARTAPAAQQWQSYPPPGFMPVGYFSERHAWHIALNPADYAVDLKTTTFAIYALDQQLRRLGAALPLDHDGADSSGFGSYSNARIVRPDSKVAVKGQPGYAVAKGRSYEAVVGGLAPTGGAAKEISWVVTFY